jgi:glycosyltransferase involved in cell wall biosynthesis
VKSAISLENRDAPAELQPSSAENAAPIRVAFVLHVMGVAGAEKLVVEIIRKLGQRIDPVVLCLDGLGALGETLQNENVPIVELGRRPGLDIAVARRMAAQIKQHGSEVVHAQQYTPFLYAAVAKMMMRPRFQLIFTEHGRHYPDIVPFKRRWANRLFFGSLADRVTAVCQFSAKSLREIEGIRVPIDVVPNGIDLPQYAASRSILDSKLQLGWDPNFRHIICIARFHPVKDHFTLLRAFSEVLRLRQDVQLILVGDGPLHAPLSNEARSLGIADHVKFLGIRDDIPLLLKAADVFVLPSLSEAASITLLEAMASGVPVVVTDVGGNSEIVRQGKEGLLVPRSDYRTMAQACLKILSDPDYAGVMGRNGRKRIEEFYRLEDTIAEYYRQYRESSERQRIRH